MGGILLTVASACLPQGCSGHPPAAWPVQVPPSTISPVATCRYLAKLGGWTFIFWFNWFIIGFTAVFGFGMGGYASIKAFGDSINSFGVFAACCEWQRCPGCMHAVLCSSPLPRTATSALIPLFAIPPHRQLLKPRGHPTSTKPGGCFCPMPFAAASSAVSQAVPPYSIRINA
jgi:hypothetical protein